VCSECDPRSPQTVCSRVETVIRFVEVFSTGVIMLGSSETMVPAYEIHSVTSQKNMDSRNILSRGYVFHYIHLSLSSILSPHVAVCNLFRVLMLSVSYCNAVNVEMLSRVAVITGNLDHFTHLHHKMIVMFDLATGKIIVQFSKFRPRTYISFRCVCR